MRGTTLNISGLEGVWPKCVYCSGRKEFGRRRRDPVREIAAREQIAANFWDLIELPVSAPLRETKSRINPDASGFHAFGSAEGVRWPISQSLRPARSNLSLEGDPVPS